jgi:hypothetical protein
VVSNEVLFDAVRALPDERRTRSSKLKGMPRGILERAA